MQEVIVFGRGAYWKKKREAFCKKYQVTAFLDNHTDGEEREENGIPVYHPRDYQLLPAHPIFLMAAMKSAIKMFHQLCSLGTDASRIQFGCNISPAFNRAEDLLRECGANVVLTEKGMSLQRGAERLAFEDYAEYQAEIRRLRREKNTYIQLFADMPREPASRHFGTEYGRAIDRYYIEKFLSSHRDMIHGNVLEVADSTYTYKFGHNITHAYKLHVYGEKDCIKGNLATGEGLHTSMVDCFICTQTLQFIYDVKQVPFHVYDLLKPGGAALITVPGISQIVLGDYERWGDYWRFTKQSLRKLMAEVFDEDKLEIESFGNLKTAFGFLYGLCWEDLTEEDFAYHDEQYQFLLTAVCRK